MTEHLRGSGELYTRRDVLEQQDVPTLLALRASLLEQYSNVERDIHLVNDVLGGLGADPGAAYDANDGTLGSPEHPEDDRWIIRSQN